MKKISVKSFVQILAIPVLVGSIANCSGAKSNPASVDAGASITGANAKVLDKVLCENPIKLDSPDLRPAYDTDVIDNVGRWNLVSMDSYILVKGTNESAYISADISDEFQPNLLCNGLSTAEAADGKISTMDLHETIGEWLNNSTHEQAPTMREIKFSFENGKVADSESNPIPNEDMAAKRFTGPINHAEVSKGVYASARRYLNASGQMEVHVKLDSKDPKTNVHDIQFVRAVYQFAN